MRGAAMKMGQTLSMESADFLPKEFADALAILRDSAETMFLHRKLVGSFMLCSRIGARVNVRKLIEPFLPPSPSIATRRKTIPD